MSQAAQRAAAAESRRRVSLWPPVVASGRIIGLQEEYELEFFPSHFSIRGFLRFPKYFFSNREVSSLLPCEVGCDEGIVGAPEIVDAIRAILADIDLAVRIGDFVDDLQTPFYGNRVARAVSESRLRYPKFWLLASG